MLKLIRRIFIGLVIATLAIIAIIYMYSSGRTYFNEEDEIGNTTGNIYNGGLFCEQDNLIYFNNPNANGKLYRMNSDMSGMKKLSDDMSVYINADENYIYYVRANNTRENKDDSFTKYNNTGVIRINQNGSKSMSFTSNPGAYLLLQGNFIYLQRYDVEQGLYVYRYKIDGSMERLLVKDAVKPAAVINNSLYYAGYSEDHYINALDLSSFTYRTVYDGSYLYPIFMDQYVYYIDIADDYHIYRMKQDGSEVTLLVNESCSTYNITNSGKYLYYQVDNGKKSRICRIDLATLVSETLLDGSYKQIHVTKDYVFFRDFNDTTTFMVYADGGPHVNTFNPPDLDVEKEKKKKQ